MENIQAPWIGRDPSWYEEGFSEDDYFDAHADDGDWEWENWWEKEARR